MAQRSPAAPPRRRSFRADARIPNRRTLRAHSSNRLYPRTQPLTRFICAQPQVASPQRSLSLCDRRPTVPRVHGKSRRNLSAPDRVHRFDNGIRDRSRDPRSTDRPSHRNRDNTVPSVPLLPPPRSFCSKPCLAQPAGACHHRCIGWGRCNRPLQCPQVSIGQPKPLPCRGERRQLDETRAVCTQM